MKVSFKPMGRLGNVCLQSFTAYAYAKRHGLEFVLPDHEYSKYFPKLSVGDLNGNRFVYYEPEHPYREIPFYNDGKNVELVGYFQSPLYFDDYREQIIDDFEFCPSFIPKTVALHIRRGDYLMYPDHHPVVTMEYLRKAVDIFCLMDMTDLRFLIFSDDLKWCKENLNDDFWNSFQYKYKHEFVEPEGDIQDMKYMSMCEHFIISNSTYSFVPAYLGISKDKVVVCPHEDNHFGAMNKKLDVKDYYPKNQNWIRVKYE